MEGISFRDSDGDIIAFEPSGSGAMIKVSQTDNESYMGIVLLDPAQLMALKAWINSTVSQKIAAADPGYIYRYDI